MVCNIFVAKKIKFLKLPILFRKYFLPLLIRKIKEQAVPSKRRTGLVTAASDRTYRGGFFTPNRFCPARLIFCSSRKHFIEVIILIDHATLCY